MQKPEVGDTQPAGFCGGWFALILRLLFVYFIGGDEYLVPNDVLKIVGIG